MTIFSSRNFIFSFRTISYFFEFQKADDHSNDSETEKTKASKFFVDELINTQTKEQKVKTISFSVSDSFFLIKKNDADDWFSFARFSKVEKKIEDATDSNTNSKKRIKIESQNSQSKWTFSNTENSAKRQTTHMNSFFKSSSHSNFETSSQSSFFNDETKAKNSTK
jgi:hypothetical protein